LGKRERKKTEPKRYKRKFIEEGRGKERTKEVGKQDVRKRQRERKKEPN
jgi:hypothetical protein